jgi:hypothetical protein
MVGVSGGNYKKGDGKGERKRREKEEKRKKTTERRYA